MAKLHHQTSALHDPDDVRDLRRDLHHHPAAARRLPDGDDRAPGLPERNDRSRRHCFSLRERYGLDQPWAVQYWKWISGILLRGDFGQSLDWNKPVSELIWARMGLTMVVSVTTLLFVWAVAFPIGIYSAVRQYSVGDYFATFFGFLGLAIPNFLLALVLMYVSAQYFGQSTGGLFSPAYINAVWSWAKLGDLISHMWIPVVVLGTGATAALIRIMRANLLDELNKPYVDMARARGLSEIRLLLKYPVRVALNPFVSTVGWVLPHLVSGSVVVSIVLSLPITGPLLLNALFAQDMYLAWHIHPADEHADADRHTDFGSAACLA